MSTEKWIAGSGQGLTWGNIFNSGSDIASMSNGNAIQSSTTISNATPLDIFADVSISLGSLTTGAGAPYIGIYLYPLNQDGSTYGDGRFGSAAAGPPPSAYLVGIIPLVPSVTQTQEGTLLGIVMPPGGFTFVLYNLSGTTLASSSNSVKYRTYNRSIA